MLLVQVTLLEEDTEAGAVIDADTLTLAVMDGVRVTEAEAVMDGVWLTLALPLCVALAVTVRVAVVLREGVTEDVPVCSDVCGAGRRGQPAWKDEASAPCLPRGASRNRKLRREQSSTLLLRAPSPAARGVRPGFCPHAPTWAWVTASHPARSGQRRGSQA